MTVLTMGDGRCLWRVTRNTSRVAAASRRASPAAARLHLRPRVRCRAACGRPDLLELAHEAFQLPVADHGAVRPVRDRAERDDSVPLVARRHDRHLGVLRLEPANSPWLRPAIRRARRSGRWARCPDRVRRRPPEGSHPRRRSHDPRSELHPGPELPRSPTSRRWLPRWRHRAPRLRWPPGPRPHPLHRRPVRPLLRSVLRAG